MKRLNLFLIFILVASVWIFAQIDAQWRGPERNGIFPGKNLLKAWPDRGPKLLWSVEKLT